MSDSQLLTQALDVIFQKYGAWVLILVYMSIKFAIPFLENKVWPEHIRRRQSIREDTLAREDKLYALLGTTTELLAGLKVTLDESIVRLSEISRMLFDIAEDIAGLYGHTARPSKKQRGTKNEN